MTTAGLPDPRRRAFSGSGGLDDVLGDLCFEVGDAPVQEAAGRPGGVEALAR
jgi:hypothetical protein